MSRAHPRPIACFVVFFVSAACSSKTNGGGVADSAGTDETDATSGGGTQGGTSTTASGETSATGGSGGSGFSSGGSSGTDTGAAFIQEPDGGSSAIQCDVWAQDCPEGQKCMPFANDGTSWNATKCVDISPSPKPPGDACKAEANRHSGVDNCEKAAMCWDVDEMTLQGTCAAFCSGTPDSPSCSDPATKCGVLNGGTITLCLPVCDPLGADCPDGTVCYPIAGDLQCIANRSPAGQGNFGDACEYLNHCNAGLLCSTGAVPGCMGNCCTAWCDLSQSNTCPGKDDGQTCVSIYTDTPPPGRENLGYCRLPPG